MINVTFNPFDNIPILAGTLVRYSSLSVAVVTEAKVCRANPNRNKKRKNWVVIRKGAIKPSAFMFRGTLFVHPDLKETIERMVCDGTH